jgi:hypothetical protein
MNRARGYDVRYKESKQNSPRKIMWKISLQDWEEDAEVTLSFDLGR